MIRMEAMDEQTGSNVEYYADNHIWQEAKSGLESR